MTINYTYGNQIGNSIKEVNRNETNYSYANCFCYYKYGVFFPHRWSKLRRKYTCISRQAKRIIRENFDELYPGVPEAEKRNILIIPWSNFINNKSVFDVELSYKGEEGMSVYVTIDRTTGKIIDKTPWDFAALINDYTSSISRDELDRIVIPLYKGALEEAKKCYPDKVKAFIDEYGADSLDLENMFFEYLFISPHGPGSADEPPHWQVFVVHKLDVNPLTNSNYGNGWFFAEIDGKTGEILESEIKYDIFSVDTRLR